MTRASIAPLGDRLGAARELTGGLPPSSAAPAAPMPAHGPGGRAAAGKIVLPYASRPGDCADAGQMVLRVTPRRCAFSTAVIS